jgi:hypothetical protein
MSEYQGKSGIHISKEHICELHVLQWSTVFLSCLLCPKNLETDFRARSAYESAPFQSPCPSSEKWEGIDAQPE